MECIAVYDPNRWLIVLCWTTPCAAVQCLRTSRQALASASAARPGAHQPTAGRRALPVLVEQVVENCSQVPEAVTADSGYFSEENVEKAASMGALLLFGLLRPRARQLR